MIIKIFDTIPSTQMYIKNLIKDGKLHSEIAVFAKMQSAGIGTHGRSWSSPIGDSFSLSIALEEARVIKRELLVFFIGFIVKKMMDSFNIEVSLKWVNDIYYNGKKLGGILTEQVENMYIIGIGLNINQKEFLENDSERISLFKIDQKQRNPEEIMHLFLDLFEVEHKKWVEDTYYFWPEIENKWYLLGHNIKIIDRNEQEIYGIFHSVKSNGCLVLETTEGRKEFYTGTLRGI